MGVKTEFLTDGAKQLHNCHFRFIPFASQRKHFAGRFQDTECCAGFAFRYSGERRVFSREIAGKQELGIIFASFRG